MAETKGMVELTVAVINQQPDPKAIIELPAVQQKWIDTYNAVSASKRGEDKFNAEKVLFMSAISSNKNLAACDKFSIYTAWMELSISGGSLRDGMCYIVPYGKKAVFLPGWKFRLEQITDMKNVVHVQQPQVVYEGDIFTYELGEKPKVHQHLRGTRSDNAKITHVYLFIEFLHSKELFIMERQDVLSIRDRFSASYKTYIAECVKAKKEIGSSFTKTMNGQNGSWELNIEPPMWVTDEAQAFKKTLVKRVYNGLPKLPKDKWLDAKIAKVEEVIEEGESNVDYNQFIGIPDGDESQTVEVVSTTINNDSATTQSQPQQTTQPASNTNTAATQQSSQKLAAGSPQGLFSQEHKAAVNNTTQQAIANAAAVGAAITQPQPKEENNLSSLAAEIGNIEESF